MNLTCYAGREGTKRCCECGNYQHQEYSYHHWWRICPNGGRATKRMRFYSRWIDGENSMIGRPDMETYIRNRIREGI